MAILLRTIWARGAQRPEAQTVQGKFVMGLQKKYFMKGCGP